jgi:hypothetical protein
VVFGLVTALDRPEAILDLLNTGRPTIQVDLSRLMEPHDSLQKEVSDGIDWVAAIAEMPDTSP